MSRIDDGLKRLAGGVAPEPRATPVLDRYTSESPARLDEVKKAARAEDLKVATFASQGSHSAASRSAAPLRMVESPAAEPQAETPAPTRADQDDVEKLIDARQVADYVGFVVRSIGRHKLLTAGMLLLTLVFTTA